MQITFTDNSKVTVNDAAHIIRPTSKDFNIDDDSTWESDRAWNFAQPGAMMVHPETKNPVIIKSVSS